MTIDHPDPVQRSSLIKLQVKNNSIRHVIKQIEEQVLKQTQLAVIY